MWRVDVWGVKASSALTVYEGKIRFVAEVTARIWASFLRGTKPKGVWWNVSLYEIVPHPGWPGGAIGPPLEEWQGR